MSNRNHVNELSPTGLTVDELIAALQAISLGGHGSAPAHALVGGTTTGPIRSAELVAAWSATTCVVALLLADDDQAVVHVHGGSLAD